MPYDEGSIFTRLLYKPDDIDLDFLDKHLFRVKFELIYCFEISIFIKKKQKIEMFVSLESPAIQNKITT